MRFPYKERKGLFLGRWIAIFCFLHIFLYRSKLGIFSIGIISCANIWYIFLKEISSLKYSLFNLDLQKWDSTRGNLIRWVSIGSLLCASNDLSVLCSTVSVVLCYHSSWFRLIKRRSSCSFWNTNIDIRSLEYCMSCLITLA